jgi:hypothetical protein
MRKTKSSKKCVRSGRLTLRNSRYFDELAQTRDRLDSRYDDLKSGRVKSIPGEEVEAYFQEKSAAARRSQPGS